MDMLLAEALATFDRLFDEAEALDTGADDFLSKPFSFMVLTARLRALMRRGTRERTIAWPQRMMSMRSVSSRMRASSSSLPRLPR